jgi:hypothetical protein
MQWAHVSTIVARYKAFSTRCIFDSAAAHFNVTLFLQKSIAGKKKPQIAFPSIPLNIRHIEKWLKYKLLILTGSMR